MTILANLLLTLTFVKVFVAEPTNLMLTGVIDGPLYGGLPKAVELYVIRNIRDLGVYSLGSANNGDGSDGEEFTFPSGPVSAGQFLYVATESSGFNQFFEFNPNYTDASATLINGNAAIELFKNRVVVDLFGYSRQDGTGTSWEYHDGWAYRNSEKCPTTEFDPSDWKFSGRNAIDGMTTNSDLAGPSWPIHTFTISTNVASACPDNVPANEPTHLMLTGVIDGPLYGGLPKAVELYVLNNIQDLGVYSLGSANNGGGSDGEEFTFPSGPVSAGQFLYVATEKFGFKQFFGFDPTYIDGSATLINGDDAIELFKNGVVVDLYGDIRQDGTGSAWEYKDGWAYRVSGSRPSAQFNLVEWGSHHNILHEVQRNDDADLQYPWPIRTFTP